MDGLRTAPPVVDLDDPSRIPAVSDFRFPPRPPARTPAARVPPFGR